MIYSPPTLTGTPPQAGNYLLTQNVKILPLWGGSAAQPEGCIYVFSTPQKSRRRLVIGGFPCGDSSAGREQQKNVPEEKGRFVLQLSGHLVNFNNQWIAVVTKFFVTQIAFQVIFNII